MKAIDGGIGIAVVSLVVLAGCVSAPQPTAFSASVVPAAASSGDVAVLPATTSADLTRPVPRSAAAIEIDDAATGITLPPMVVRASATSPSTLNLLMRGDVVRCPGCAVCGLIPERDGWRLDEYEHGFVFRPALIFGRNDQEIVVHIRRLDPQTSAESAD